MRLPRVRFTVRRLMVLVAVVAIGIAVPIAVARYFGKAMDDFYGRGGYLDQRGKAAEKP